MGTKHLEIVLIKNRHSILGKMCKLFTGCYAYHIGFLKNDMFYDMQLMRTRRRWPCYTGKHTEIIKIKAPVDIPEEYFIDKILNDNTTYGILDYLWFGLRWFRAIEKKTRNQSGLICSEMVNQDLIAHGWNSPWGEKSAPPSPCDFAEYFKK